ncbi:MAG: TetR/AcrR family transcriptional regulator [Candidatus Izemoplasmatales bacterium]|jgi:AcrR family transcriptional regulator|nr:TetR/AcrR family transcriptional regulator [Candidatus Izemoplasmatales bacterium]
MKYSDKTAILLENKDLFKATLAEFSEKPYNLASTNEIILKSGINKGSFYYRFSNKEELFVAIMDYVIVTQIDLFNQRKDYSSMESLNSLFFELFYNLYLLHNEDEKFLTLLSLHLKDSYASKIISSLCVEPLIERFKVKFDLYNKIDYFQDIMIVFENLYYNFPTSIFKKGDVYANLKRFVDFILTKNDFTSASLKEPSVDLTEFIPSTPISYLVVENQALTYPKDCFMISTHLDNYDNIAIKLKKMTRLFRLTIEKTVNVFINRSFKNLDYLLVFNSNNVKILSKNNQILEKLLLIFLFLIVTEEPKVILDLDMIGFSQEEKRLIYLDILPILGKTSKIIVVSNSIEADYINENVYYVDYLKKVIKLSSDSINKISKQNVEIQFDNDSGTKIEYIEMAQLFDANKKIRSVRTINKIDYQTIINLEGKI